MADDFDIEAMLEAPFKKEALHRDDLSTAWESMPKDEGEGRSRENHADKENRRNSTSSSSKRKRSRSKERPNHRHGRNRRSQSRDRNRKSRSQSRSRKSPSQSRSRKSRSHSRGRKNRSDSRSRRSQSRERRRRSVSRGREVKKVRAHSHERARLHKEKKRSHSRSPPRREPRRHRSRSKTPPGIPPASQPVLSSPVSPSILPARSHNSELTPEERDARTIFCMQLSQRVRARDLEEFFSSVGKVKDVRIITDNKTRRSKGIAYIEFAEVRSVSLALGLSGQRVLGAPIIIQPTQAEKNRAAANANNLQKGNIGPMRLYVGSLHFNITEDMLRGIFEPFGKIDKIELIRDPETGRSKGYGFITFIDSEDAKKALEQLNGFELAGRPMKIGHVTERTDTTQGPSFLDSDELDRTGIDLGATGRLQLMAKLAEGTGFQLPQAAVNALQMTAVGLPGQPNATPPIATQCFMLSNMFDPATESNPTWDEEIRNDVIDECRNHGGALHVFVDKASPQGNVYVKCPSIAAAVASVNALHGRWFAGRVITAAYVPVVNYHTLFPDAANAHLSL